MSNNLVDYILFLAVDLTLDPNPNEVSEAIYVSKEELEAMFADPGELADLSEKISIADSNSQLFHTLVQTHSSRPVISMVGRNVKEVERGGMEPGKGSGKN